MGPFEITRHGFTPEIVEILEGHFGDYASDILASSPILGYLNTKTKAANRGSKARGSFANHYALYVVVEDYIQKGFFDGTADTRPTPNMKALVFPIYFGGNARCHSVLGYRITHSTRD